MTKKLFEVIVVATMSAGKSTLINALIGEELLHSANEATTATITSIHNKDSFKKFIGVAYDYSDKLVDYKNSVDADLLKDWNSDEEIKTINLMGNFRDINNSKYSEIVIYDTPGPNNSQDEGHELLTMEVVNDGNYGLILYILNATQLGVQGDYDLLKKIHQNINNEPTKKILFILNKADQIDEEKEESLNTVVKNAEKYLTEIGFKKPEIVPLSAKISLLAQKVLNKEKLTRSEFYELIKNINVFGNKNINQNAIVSAKIKNKLNERIVSFTNEGEITIRGQSFSIKSLRQLKANSGLDLVKIILQQYLVR